MSINFLCLLVDNEGEPLGEPFVIESHKDQYLSQVAGLVLRENPDIQVQATRHISLWKANPPFPESSLSELSRRVKALHLNVTGNEREAVQLQKGRKLGEVFPPHLPLPPKHIHIIAQLRTPTVSPPQSPGSDIENIDRLIEKEFKSIRVDIEAFLRRSPILPTWVPPDGTTPSCREFYARLQIPQYHNGFPSLLLHELDSRDTGEIEKIIERDQHMYLQHIWFGENTAHV